MGLCEVDFLDEAFTTPTYMIRELHLLVILLTTGGSTHVVSIMVNGVGVLVERRNMVILNPR